MAGAATNRTLSRRGLIQFGLGSYLGLNLGGLWRARAAAGPAPQGRSIRSCVLVFLYGGPSHIDTFDPKPDAPAEVRGEFQPIATSVPGAHICEHLPRLARLMHKIAIIRSMHHAAHLHDSGSIQMLTGRPLDGPDRELFAPLPQFFPCYGSAVTALRPAPGCDVPFASLPFRFQNVVPTPCQGGGFLGSQYEPLWIDVNPAGQDYQIEPLQPREGLGRERRRARLDLLASIERDRTRGPLNAMYEKAVHLLDSEPIRRAIDVRREPAIVRERYGFGAEGASSGEASGGALGYAREMRGQNYLLARRLVEEGVPFINIYDYQRQGQNWDAHAHCADQHKRYLLPPFDQGLSALIEDLDARGLLDSTLIVATGEFGRTPKINTNGGRDHWPECSSVLLAGGGIAGGTIYGASDRIGAYPTLSPVTPGDLAATIYQRFGIDPETPIRDQNGRPYPLADGKPLTGLFAS